MTISTVPPDRNLPISPMRYDPRAQIETKADNLDLASAFRMLRRRRFMIIAITVLLMAPAAVTISGLKPTYQAWARLIVHQPLATSLGAEDTGRGDLLDVKSETERLLSRSIAERVVREMRLDARQEFNPALRKVSFFESMRASLRGLFETKKPTSPERDGIEATIREFYQALGVWHEDKSEVIQISFTANDAELAAAVPNRVVSIYLDERKSSVRARLDAAEAWIRQRIAEQKARAVIARDAARNYQESMDIVSKEDAQDERIKTLLDLTGREGKIEESRVEIKATISALEAADNPSVAVQNIVVPDSIATKQRDLRAQQDDLARLLELYDGKAEAVVDLRRKIEQSRLDLDLATKQYLQSMRAKLAALDHEANAVQSILAVAEQKRTRDALAQAELTRLQHIAEKEQAALDKLEDQRRDLAAKAMLPGAELEVFSPASVPLVSQGRGRLFYLVGTLLAAISAAVTAAFALEMWDQSVRSFDQIAGMARTIPAGLIPRLARKENPKTVFRLAPVPMFDEAIRTVILTLKQSNGGKLPNSIVVTSAHSGEGKSLVARSLAIELAAAAIPVLLVDGDLRRGELDSFFRSGLQQGLNEYLNGHADIRDIVYHHPGGIDFIPSGKFSLQRRARSNGLAEIIEMAGAAGRVVIFDSAPVLASTDTVLLTALAEKTLAVVRWGKTSRRAVEFSLQQMKSQRNSEIIVAINNVNPEKHALYNFSDSELFSKSLMKYYQLHTADSSSSTIKNMFSLKSQR
ncbi:lipopolysaccharide biosynthesis protein (plasmid) [Rhizobium phaseoli]|uniref:Lipopolysaccharide biosynthesis protein n=1 Tax=Rhizobium phaseoli TaxID=396 RepID=A0ABM6CJM4_9HYPH|nr:tyrosine-protein kinase domain-containing protein [Rhizobium phaseoli]KEC70348.1 lipopolysaccharide biosynthesis protein [Rhizobium leguminosarum bv. phaseoli CCGM1]ANL31304.1 lipopolysaccharide biosynthesis protein [Rhizobium phaseoli]ANL37758.1 lipopolysaccharide biosynthesis protein [Rhizobium phaseoli]ANL56756.1 lipopolysaccharide biosynthesis protein [Rhizobium phaseoli]ANL69252.1 lipopolysaccharide biosynthesis protein [Rhizobium phaseoli]